MTSAIRIRRCNQGDEKALALVGQTTFLETFAGVLDGKDIIAHCEKAHDCDQYAAWLNDPAYGLLKLNQETLRLVTWLSLPRIFRCRT